MVHEEVRFTTKELNDFANSLKQKSREYAGGGWILRVRDDGKKTQKWISLVLLMWIF